MAPMCKSRYSIHFAGCKEHKDNSASNFLSTKFVRLARISEKSYELACKMFAAVPERIKNKLEPILEKKFMGYASENFSDFKRQKQKGSTAINYNAADDSEEIQRVMMDVETLMEASGKRNWRSIISTHDEFPCHCFLQTWWYPG